MMVIVGLYVVHLSKYEIQPWDEGLYAVRGESIVRFGNIIDQSEHALGGEYSSTPPPMASWGVALGIAAFGRNTFGVRVFSIVCSAICLLALYSICVRHLSHRSSLIAVILLATAIPWVVYSRQAMSEIPLITGMLLCWSALYLAANNRIKNNLLIAVALFAAGFAAALLSKYVIGFLPLVLIILVWENSRAKKTFLVGGLIGFALAMPWFVWMAINHQAAFIDAIVLRHLTEVVEGNSGGGNYLYTLNQLIVGQPAFIIAIGSVIALTRTLRKSFDSEPWVVVAMLWFSIGLVVFTLSATKNPHYVVLLLPPAAMLTLWAYERVTRRLKTASVYILCAIVWTTAVWSALPSLRGDVKALHFSPLVFVSIAFIAAAVFFVIVFHRKKFFDGVTMRMVQYSLVGLCIVGFTRAAFVVWKGRPDDIKGGKAVAAQLLESTPFNKHFAYLFHAQNVADSINPQLAWYTAGWMSNWDSSYTYTPHAMPNDSADVGIAATTVYQMPLYIVYYHPGIAKEQQQLVATTAALLYDVAEESGVYTLFRRR
ncbi:MAG: glycosyltransferase family 39 protein [Ignavibacteria bacterium]|nr:glycosyltransferase family 39 protein [Ignavibacteria bacterium]